MSSEDGSISSETQRTNNQQRLRVRREPFEYGLLPLPTLIFPDPATALRGFRTKLLTEDLTLTVQITRDSHGDAFIDAAGIVHALDLTDDEAQLVVESLLSVLPESTSGGHSPVDSSAEAVSLSDLVLFLYIQSYKKPPLRSHKDAAAVADVWPSTSAFDGLITTLSPLQVRTSKKSAPSQADEESHRLAYVRKHLPALLSLLTDPVNENESDGQLMTLEQFNHLGFLLCFGGSGSGNAPLSQSSPFFANSDPDMPAAPVPVQQVLEWLLEHISSVSEGSQEKRKENGLSKASDVTMTDACVSANPGVVSPSSSTANTKLHEEGLMFVDGITKASVLKDESDICGGSVKVVNCHESVIYILAPIKYASVYGCSDSVIVLGAAEKVVRIEHCERVQLIVSSVRICITNCRECIFYLAVNQRPLILGENHNLQVAPYNTFYPKLEAHIARVGVNPAVNRWDKFLTLGVIDPHDSLPHAADVSDTLAEGASILPPDRYINFVIPKWSGLESSDQSFTKANPFPLPKAYIAALQQRKKAVDALRQNLKSLPIDESKRQELSQAIHVHFREWLYASGNIRQLYEFQDFEADAGRIN